jgi:hypothetical protein
MTWRARLVALLLVGCAGCGSSGAGDAGWARGDGGAEQGDAGHQRGDDAAPPADAAPGSDDGGIEPDDAAAGDLARAEDAGQPAERWPRPCGALHADDELPDLELRFSEAQWAGLLGDCASRVQRYRPATFSWKGRSAAAMVRLKGFTSWNCEKMQFVISFNEEDPAGRFEGLRKIVLDAPPYDRTLLHERVAVSLFEARGLPHHCVNNARLSINGAYHGLYANLERLDKEYLERNFAESDGNLYQAGTELKTNEDVGDVSRQVELAENSRDLAVIARLVDLDQAVAEWAVEAMLPAIDNYWAGTEINYYLYDHPSRGFLFLPYDLDMSFAARNLDGTPLLPGVLEADPIAFENGFWGKEELLKTVLADPFWCSRFVDELHLARAAYDPAALAARVAAWEAQIGPSFAEDPHAHYTFEAHQEGIAELTAFFAARAEVVDAWLALQGHCPARW